MRLKPGRPDLPRSAHLRDVPPAGSGLAVTFLGVSTLLVDDGRSALMTDGFFSRPSLLAVGLGSLPLRPFRLGPLQVGGIAPDARRVDACLARAGVGSLEAVLPVHTHYDHALDSALVAERTGAVLVGGRSAANLGRGHGLPEDRIRVAVPGEPMRFGAFTVTLVESAHCPPDRFPGVIGAPVVPPARVGAYRCGEAWSVLLEHASGRTALVQGSAGFVPGALDGQVAEVAYLGVGQLGLRPESYLAAYWEETVRAVGARRVVLTHWDDFFRPLDRPLRALPYAGDDLDLTLRVLGRLAAEDGVALHLPEPWRRGDPWG